MANEVMIPSGNNLPAHIAALLAANPGLLSINENASAGIGGGSNPKIIAYMGAFKTKVDGVEEPIQIQTEAGPMNASKISAVILAAKKNMVRNYYVGAFVQGQEPQSPDCFSRDGVKPDASSPNKQCESCAGCPQNVWGSAKQQAAHGLALPTVVTSISFDPVTPTKLVFSYLNVLDEKQLGAVIPMIDSPEVKAIIEDGFAPAPQGQIAAPAQDKEAEAKAAAEKAEAEKKAKAAEAKAKKDAEAKAKKEAEEKAKAAASTSDLGLDAGSAGGSAGGASGPSDDELAALINL